MFQLLCNKLLLNGVKQQPFCFAYNFVPRNLGGVLSSEMSAEPAGI